MAQQFVPPQQQVPDIQQNVGQEIVPFELNWDDDSADFDLLNILSEVEENQQQVEAQHNVPGGTGPNTNTTSSRLMQQRNSPMFAGCKIETSQLTFKSLKRLILKASCYLKHDKY